MRRTSIPIRHTPSVSITAQRYAAGWLGYRSFYFYFVCVHSLRVTYVYIMAAIKTSAVSTFQFSIELRINEAIETERTSDEKKNCTQSLIFHTAVGSKWRPLFIGMPTVWNVHLLNRRRPFIHSPQYRSLSIQHFAIELHIFHACHRSDTAELALLFNRIDGQKEMKREVVTQKKKQSTNKMS